MESTGISKYGNFADSHLQEDEDLNGPLCHAVSKLKLPTGIALLFGMIHFPRLFEILHCCVNTQEEEKPAGILVVLLK